MLSESLKGCNAVGGDVGQPPDLSLFILCRRFLLTSLNADFFL